LRKAISIADLIEMRKNGLAELKHFSEVVSTIYDCAVDPHCWPTGLLVEGCSANEIAETLKVAATTVRTHIARLMEKAGVKRQSELMRLVMQLKRMALHRLRGVTAPAGTGTMRRRILRSVSRTGIAA
jgi:hypothetical protein